MIGMPFGKKSPKSELHEFFQLHPGNPTFDIQPKSNPPAEPLFLCTLTCPAIGGPQGLPEQTFTGQGRNKKTAEQYASEKALDFLRQRGLMAPAIVQMPDQQLPLDLQKQLASPQMVPLHDLQLKAMNSRALAPPLQNTQTMQTPTTSNGTGGHGVESRRDAQEDYDSMEKDDLVAKLKQALRENQRLKFEVEQEQDRRQGAIDMLLGVKPKQLQ
ncbi:hypothetical protein ABBQ32_000878 [Trebouxia sp. C0010 RCD-2024]